MAKDIAVTKAFVRDNTEIAPEHFEMTLEIEGEFRRPDPGQFVMVRMEEEGVFLPRPFSICNWEDVRMPRLTILYRVVGEGTGRMSRWDGGKSLEVMGPLGRAFTLPGADRNVVLVGGGVGMAPLLYLLQRCASEGRQTGGYAVYIGARTASLLLGTAKAEGFGATLLTSTDDGSEGFCGTITERFAKDWGKFDETLTSVYACGPRPMLQGLQTLFGRSGMTCEVSLEERMACGLGACLGCAVSVRDDRGKRAFLRVCKEGPVFPIRDVVWD